MSLSSALVQAAVQQSLSQVFGKIGGAIPFDVLGVKQTTDQAFLRVDQRCVYTVTFAYFWRLALACTSTHTQVSQLTCCDQFGGLYAVRDSQKFRAAITLLTSYDGEQCHFRVRHWPEVLQRAAACILMAMHAAAPGH